MAEAAARHSTQQPVSYIQCCRNSCNLVSQLPYSVRTRRDDCHKPLAVKSMTMEHCNLNIRSLYIFFQIVMFYIISTVAVSNF